MIRIYFVASFLAVISYVSGYNCAPNDRDFTKGCQTLVTSGYNYQHFFPVEQQPNGDIFLKFYVKTETDAHVLFSNNSPKGSETLGRHYEIIIGAYDNSISAIRTRKQGENLVPYHERGINSPVKWRGFWIRISSDGLIEVGKGTNGNTFLSWKDPNPFQINYYSLSCWAPGDLKPADFQSKHIANWIHQCSSDNYLKYNMDNFKCDLLSNYDQRIFSTDSTHSIIQINIVGSYADWDNINGIFHLIGTATVTWQDIRLIWRPTENYQQSSLNLTNDYPIWRPEITVTNAAFHSNPLGSGKITVSHDGAVTWIAPLNLQATCSNSVSQTAPPDTTHKCRINLFVNTFGSEILISEGTNEKISSPWTVNEAHAVNVGKVTSKSPGHSPSIEVSFRKNVSTNRNNNNSNNAQASNAKCIVFSGLDIDKPYLI